MGPRVDHSAAILCIPVLDSPSMDPRTQVILLHGTALFPWMVKWARQWTREGSPLREELQRQFGDQCQIEPFEWSGRNTFRARLQAAQALQDRLMRIGPNARAILVCHSHAGNIALLACRKDEVQARIAGIVTMATPYLVVRRRPMAARASTAAGVVLLAMYAVAALVVTFYISYFFLIVTGSEQNGFIAFAVTALAAIYVAIRSKNRWRAAATPLGSEHVLPDVFSTPLLILRCAGDEASGVLSTAAIASMAATRAWTRLWDVGTWGDIGPGLTRFPWVLITIAASIAAVFGLGWLVRYEYLEGNLEWGFLLLVPALLLGAFAAIVVSAPLSFLAWRYGWGLLGTVAALPLSFALLFAGVPFGIPPGLCGLMTEITVEPTPLGRWEVETYSSAPAAEGSAPLNHSQVYVHPHAIARICEWIRGLGGVAGRLEGDAPATQARI